VTGGQAWTGQNVRRVEDVRLLTPIVAAARSAAAGDRGAA
jgi:hypothetical protein